MDYSIHKKAFPCNKFDIPSIQRKESCDSIVTRSSSILTRVNILPIERLHSHYTLESRYGSSKILTSSFSSFGILSKRELSDFAIKKTLGQGSFAKVKLCQSIKNGEKLAVKIIEKV